MHDSAVCLFVYGTLLSEVPSAMSAYLKQEGELIASARLPGFLYDLGRYPGFVYKPEATAFVWGEVHRLLQPNLSLPLLDRYEGIAPGDPHNEYARIMAPLPAGSGLLPAAAWVYAYLGATTGLPLIHAGDYRAYFSSRPAHQQFILQGRG